LGPEGSTPATRRRSAFAIPAPPVNEQWPDVQQKVTITTPDDATTSDDKALLIVADQPLIKSLVVTTLKQGSNLTVPGKYFLPVGGGDTPTVKVTDTAALHTVKEFVGKPMDAQLQVPLPGDLLPAGADPRGFDVAMSRSGVETSKPVTLSATP
jgi:hypothetical protein